MMESSNKKQEAMMIPVNLDATVVATGATITNSTISGIQQAGVIKNYYGPQDQWDANKLEGFVPIIRTHLCQFYQREAEYIGSLLEEDRKWPIVETYRQLALVTATESRILYVVKALDATQLPDASMFASPAIVVTTATREAYFIEQGRWLREQQSGSLIRIQGVVLPKNLEAIQESDPRRVIEHKGASQILKQVMEKYAHVGGREAVLRTYETPYEHYEKRQIALEQVWEPPEGENPPQRILVTGRAGIGKSTLLQYIAYCWSLDGSQAVPEHIKPLWQEQYTWVIWLPLKLLHREECVEGSKKATSYQRIAYFIQKVCGLEQLEAAEDSNFTKSLAKLLRQHEARMLLLVDSFDEVAHWVNTDCLQGQLLRALFAWQGPMIVTTRPYAQPQLPQTWKPDRLIENEGFLDADIEAFVRHYFERIPQAITDNKATRLLRILRQNIGIWSLAHVPLMTRLLCLHWQQATAVEQALAEQMGELLTLTGILKVFVEGFVRRSVKKMAKDQDIVYPEDDKLLPSQQLEALYEQHHHWLAILAHLAYEGLRQGQNQILSSNLQETIFRKALPEPESRKCNLLSDDRWKNQAGLLFQDVLKLGFLQPVDQTKPNPLDMQHTFLHLLFQEYLAAHYITCHLEESEIQVWIRINRYLGKYQYVFAFVSGLVNDARRQQDYWGLLRDSPSTLNGLAELELGLMCLPETRHRSALEDKVQPLFAASQDWLVRLMNPEEVFLAHEVLWVTQRLLPLWQRLSIADGMRLLGKWQTQLMRWMKNTEDAEEAKRVIRLCQVLGPIGAPLIGWLPEGFIKAGIDRLTLEDWEKREQGLQVLIGLRQQLITQEDWVVALVSLILTGSPSSKLVSVTLLQQLNPEQLLSYSKFKRELNACLESLELEIQTWGWRLLRCLGEPALADKVLWSGIEAAWWSWDFELHWKIEHDLEYFTYRMPKFAQWWYLVIQALQSEDRYEYKAALQVITRWCQAPGIQQFQRGLRQALHVRRTDLRRVAMKTLAALGNQKLELNTYQKSVETGLFDEDRDIRASMWSVLAQLGPGILTNSALCEHLRASLVYQDVHLQQAALRVLGKVGAGILSDSTLLECLKFILVHQDKRLRRAALKTLGQLGTKVLAYPELREGLQNGLDAYEEEVQVAALEALGQLGGEVLSVYPKLWEQLQNNLVHQDKRLRCAVLKTLGQLGAEVLAYPELREGLQNGLDHDNEEVRAAALGALGQLGAGALKVVELRERVKASLVHHDRRIRQAVLRIFGQLGVEVLSYHELLVKLEACLKEDEDLQTALEVLGQLGAEVLAYPEFREGLQNGLNHDDEEVRVVALEVLGQLGAEVLAYPELREGLQNGLDAYEEEVQVAALEALGQLGGEVLLVYPELREQLQNNLDSEDEEIRVGAWCALAQLGTGESEVAKSLCEKLKTGLIDEGEEQWWISCSDAEVEAALQACRDDEKEEELRTGLVDNNARVRSGAWSVLGQLGALVWGDSVLCEKLRTSLVGEDDVEVRSAVWHALGQLGPEVLGVAELREELWAGLVNEDAQIRGAALSVLGQWGSSVWKNSALCQGLQAGLEKDDEGIQGAVVGQLGSEVWDVTQLCRGLKDCLDHDNTEIQAAALRTLGHLGAGILKDTALWERVESSLDSEDEKVRVAAWCALRDCDVGELKVAKLLREKLKADLASEDEEELEMSGYGEREKKLRTGLVDNNQEVLVAAWSVLSQLGSKILKDHVLREKLEASLVDEDDVRVQVLALSVIGHLGAEVLNEESTLYKRLRDCLFNEDEELRTAALEALSPLSAEILKDSTLCKGLVACLVDEYEKIRAAAWSVLSQLGVGVLDVVELREELGNYLVGNGYLFDESGEIKVLALEVLGKLGHRALKVEGLLKGLKACLVDDNKEVRVSALRVLEHLGPGISKEPALYKELKACLHDQDREVRAAALLALGHLGRMILLKKPALYKGLRASLHDQDGELRAAALSALGRLGTVILNKPALYKGLQIGLCGKDRKVRVAALSALGHLGTVILKKQTLCQGLRDGLRARDGEVRAAAFSALGHLGTVILGVVELRQGLQVSLLSKNKKIQDTAWLILGQWGTGVLENTEFCKWLKQNLFDTNEIIKTNAWRVLKQFIPQLLDDPVLQGRLKDIIGPISNKLASGKARTVAKALKSLTGLGSFVLEYELLRGHLETVLQRWETESVVLAVLSLLSKFGPRCLDYPIMFDSVCYYLNSPSTEVRCAALNCLGAMGPKLLEVMTSNHLNQEVTKPSLMEQHTQEILLKIDLSLGDTILEAAPASQLLRAILEEEPQLNEKVHQVVKALSGTARIRLWRDWLQEIVSNPELQPASVREQFYLFLASLVEIPGCLAGVLFALKNEDMMHQHSSLLECLLTPQNLRVLLKEYQQVIDSHADSGLTVREYVDLIQWLLQRPRIRAVLDSDHIILYEETVYHRIRLDAEKIRQLQPPNLLRSQADISMPDCQATLFAAPKQDLDPDPKEPPSRFAHLYCQLI